MAFLEQLWRNFTSEKPSLSSSCFHRLFALIALFFAKRSCVYSTQLRRCLEWQTKSKFISIKTSHWTSPFVHESSWVEKTYNQYSAWLSSLVSSVIYWFLLSYWLQAGVPWRNKLKRQNLIKFSGKPFVREVCAPLYLYCKSRYISRSHIHSVTRTKAGSFERCKMTWSPNSMQVSLKTTVWCTSLSS